MRQPRVPLILASWLLLPIATWMAFDETSLGIVVLLILFAIQMCANTRRLSADKKRLEYQLLGLTAFMIAVAIVMKLLSGDT